jgi:hypothetical protein
MCALNTILYKAIQAGIASNRASIQQQLQQSGMPQQLSALLAAMTAEFQAETAVLAAGGWDAASGDIERFAAPSALQARFAVVAQYRSLIWDFWARQGPSAAAEWGSSGHAVAAMRFATAALQHISSEVRYVLPAVRKRSAPQHAAAFESSLQGNSRLAVFLCMCVTSTKGAGVQQGQRSEGNVWGQLLLLPQLLPCASAMALIGVRRVSSLASSSSSSDSDSSGIIGSSCSSSSAGQNSGRDRSSSSRRSTPGKLEQQQQSSPLDSSNNRSSGTISDNVMACELQLLQLLGLASEVADWAMHRLDFGVSCHHLHLALAALIDCCDASQQRLLHSSSTGASDEQQQQQFESQLWQLLPMVLLPCANSLLLPSAPHFEEGDVLVRQLLTLSMQAMQLSAQLHSHLQALGIPTTTAPAAWVEEVLGVLLQLAARLLYQQPPTQIPAATSEPTRSSSSSASHLAMTQQSMCAARLLQMLLHVARDSQALCGNDSRSDASNSSATAAYSSRAVAVTPLAAKFVGFVTALEASLRVFSETLQSGAYEIGTAVEVSRTISSLCKDVLLLNDEQGGSLLMQQMGLHGPVALAQEQQQLYSLLSTLQRVRCAVGEEGVWYFGEHMVASCCLAAAHSAVGLLKAAVPPAPAGASTAAEQHMSSSIDAAAAAQQPVVVYVPTLVLFGRCLVQWAQQLQQQASEIVLLGPGQPWHEHYRHMTPLVYEHGAARVCIPGMQHGPSLSPIKPGERLESLAAIVDEWVGRIDPSAHQQLAAAGCSPQQLQQQLEALLSAQQGMQQGLTEASIAALVQQLQKTGAMLCSIAVPHFCNNPSCANLSGRTEVQLVSGRSCICAGCCTARYCGPACQRAAWKQHKPVCKALAAAAATAAAES